MAAGRESEEEYTKMAKRYGAPYSNRNPENTLDAMLDFYLAHPTSAPIHIKEGASDNVEYSPEEFSSYIDPAHNEMDPRGDVDSNSHIDSSWARDRD